MLFPLTFCYSTSCPHNEKQMRNISLLIDTKWWYECLTDVFKGLIETGGHDFIYVNMYCSSCKLHLLYAEGSHQKSWEILC